MDKRDLHKEKAAAIFGVPYEQVTDKQRKYAKMVGYAELYDTSQSLKDKLNKMKEQAK